MSILATTNQLQGDPKKKPNSFLCIEENVFLPYFMFFYIR